MQAQGRSLPRCRLASVAWQGRPLREIFSVAALADALRGTVVSAQVPVVALAVFVPQSGHSLERLGLVQHLGLRYN